MSRHPGNSDVNFYAHAAVEFFIFMSCLRIIMSKVPGSNLRSGQYAGIQIEILNICLKYASIQDEIMISQTF